MRTPLAATPSFARRMVLLAVALAGLAACTSNIDNAASGNSSSGSTSSSTATSSTTTSVAVVTTSTTTTTIPPTTTTNPIVTKGGVVKVANSSGVNGAAGVLTGELGKLGFVTRKATNGVGPDGDLKVSKIYVKHGSEKVAASLSRLMGGIAVVPMPTPVWITDAQVGLADATVVVMLGHDLAGKPLAEMAP